MEYPGSFNTAILKRAFTEKEFASLVDSYTNAKLRSGQKEPTPGQREMATMVKKLGSPKLAATKLKTNVGRIQYAVTKVARWNYFND